MVLEYLPTCTQQGIVGKYAIHAKWGPQTIAKLVYNFNHYSY